MLSISKVIHIEYRLYFALIIDIDIIRLFEHFYLGY